MRKIFVTLGAALSFSLSTMALDYVCEGKTVRFNFVNGDPTRDARLQVNDNPMHIALTEQQDQKGESMLSGILTDTYFRSFSIVIRNVLEFDTVMKLEGHQNVEEQIHCTLIML